MTVAGENSEDCDPTEGKSRRGLNEGMMIDLMKRDTYECGKRRAQQEVSKSADAIHCSYKDLTGTMPNAALKLLVEWEIHNGQTTASF